MERLQILLLFVFNRYEAHRRPRYRLTNSLGVVRIILVAFAVGYDELRAHQLDRVAELFDLSRPIVRRASIPTRHGSSFTRKPSSCLRVIRRCTTTRPSGSTPCRPNVSFARSIPSVLTFTVDPPRVSVADGRDSHPGPL